jgi:hypothetical protein
LLAVGRRRERWPLWAITWILALYPEVLSWTIIPLKTLREGLVRFHSHSIAVRQLSRTRAREILRSRIVLPPNGRIDLAALGILLTFFRAEPADALLDVFTVAELALNARRDPFEAAILLEAGRDSVPYRQRVVEPLSKKARWSDERIVVLRLLATPTNMLRDFNADQDPIVKNVTAGNYLSVLKLLLVALETPGVRISLNKVNVLAHRMAARFSEAPLVHLLQLLVTAESEKARRMATTFLVTILQNDSTAHLIAASIGLRPQHLHELLERFALLPEIPFGKEQAFVHAFLDHPDPRVRKWAQTKSARSPSPPTTE